MVYVPVSRDMAAQRRRVPAARYDSKARARCCWQPPFGAVGADTASHAGNVVPTVVSSNPTGA